MLRKFGLKQCKCLHLTKKLSFYAITGKTKHRTSRNYQYSPVILTRRARHHENLLQQVTKQWRQEYLTGVREQSNARNKGNAVQEISVGDRKFIHPTRGINDFMLVVSASLPASGWGSSST